MGKSPAIAHLQAPYRLQLHHGLQLLDGRLRLHAHHDLPCGARGGAPTVQPTAALQEPAWTERWTDRQTDRQGGAGGRVRIGVAGRPRGLKLTLELSEGEREGCDS